MRLLVFAPHLDDAALSVGGLLQLVRAPKIVSVFSRSGWTLERNVRARRAVQSVSQLRAREERRALRRLGASLALADLEDAPLRGYALGELLGHDHLSADLVLDEVVRAVMTHVEGNRPMFLLGPLGLGGHIDHLLTAHALCDVSSATGTPVAYYEDLPYAEGLAEPRAHAQVRRLLSVVHPVDVRLNRRTLERKLEALACYPSQLRSNDLARVWLQGFKRRGERLYVAQARHEKEFRRLLSASTT